MTHAGLDADRLRALATRLESVPKIAELAAEGELGGWRGVAYALLEIEEAARKISEALITAVEAQNGAETG